MKRRKDREMAAELARLDAIDAELEARRAKFYEVGRMNAVVGVDVNDVEGYRDNVGDTVKEMGGDENDWNVAYRAFEVELAKL